MIKVEPQQQQQQQQHQQMMNQYMVNPHLQLMYQNQYPPNYNFKNVGMPGLNLQQPQQPTIPQMNNMPLNMRPNIMYSQQQNQQTSQLSPRVSSQQGPGSPVTVQQLSPRLPHSPQQQPGQQPQQQPSQQPLSPRLSSSQQLQQIQQLQQQQQPQQQLSPRLHIQQQLSPRPTQQLSPRPPRI